MDCIRIRDLAWAAGFIEGEGYFEQHHAGVNVCQLQQEPLRRLKAMFGGSLRYQPHWNKQKNGIWRWLVFGRKAAAVMLTIFSLMSPKRKKEITRIMRVWKLKRVGTSRLLCGKGCH